MLGYIFGKTGYKVALNCYFQRASQLPESFDNLDAVSGHKWVKWAPSNFPDTGCLLPAGGRLRSLLLVTLCPSVSRQTHKVTSLKSHAGYDVYQERRSQVNISSHCFLPEGVVEADSSRDAEHGQQDHPPAGAGGTLPFRDDKQETMVVRPYPQVQTHGQPQAAPQTVPIQPGTPVAVPAPSVHLPQGQPAVLTEGQMKVKICRSIHSEICLCLCWLTECGLWIVTVPN